MRKICSFHFVFFGIGQFVTGVGENLQAVVLEWVMRGRDHHASGVFSSAGEPRYAGRSDYTCEACVDSAAFESIGKLRRDGGAGFAGVHTYQDGVTRPQIFT